MSSRERFTWIGPVSDASSAGEVARGFVAGLARMGSLAQVLDTGDGTVAVDFDLDGEVRAQGSTVVRQAPLSRLATTAAMTPLESDSRQVAYVVVDGAHPPDAALEVLAQCQEVWAPSTLQAELLCSLGVERARVMVVAPGTESTHVAPPCASSSGSRALSGARALVIGDARIAAELERLRADGPHFVHAPARSWTPAFEAELARADMVVVLSDADPWGRIVLDAAKLGKPLFHVESGTALEYVDTDDCVWFDAATANDPLRLSRCLREASIDLDSLARRAVRARERVDSNESLEAAARAVVARATRPRVLPEARLARILTELGLPTPAERLAGSRARVLVVPVTGVEGPWHRTLRAHLAAAKSRTDTTICLWVDDGLAPRNDEISTLVESEIARTGATEVDVLVVVAPLAHAPREDFVTSAA